MKLTWKQLFFSFVAGALGGAGWWLYSRRPQERLPSPEALDDPEVARAYGWVATLPQMRLLRSFVAHRAVQMTERGEAADLGCGPGLLVVELARRSPGLHVTGIDLAEDLLAQGEEYARRAGLGERVSFRQGDVKQIPFPDDSLDLVISTLSLHHWSEPIAVLDEVARVLRPGGSFLIFDLRRDMLAPIYLLLWFAQHVIVPGALRRAGEPLGSRNAAYTPEEAAQLAEESQLRDWRVTRSPLWLTIESVGAKHSPTQTV